MSIGLVGRFGLVLQNFLFNFEFWVLKNKKDFSKTPGFLKLKIFHFFLNMDFGKIIILLIIVNFYIFIFKKRMDCFC